MVQRRDHPDHTWFIGKGKATELHELCLEVDADTVVFDNNLSPAQQYNLEKLLGRTAIDRTAVIRPHVSEGGVDGRDRPLILRSPGWSAVVRAATGSDTVKVEPRPSSDSTRIEPPCCCTTCRAIARPSPVPPPRTRTRSTL